MITAKDMLSILNEYQLGDKLGDKVKKNITKSFALEDLGVNDIIVIDKTAMLSKGNKDDDIKLKVTEVGEKTFDVKLDGQDVTLNFNDVEVIDAFSRKDSNNLIVAIDLPASLEKELFNNE
jgi:hypothetical protein